MLPTRSPAVIATRRVPCPPRPTMHLTDVSDSHSVPSHPVCPICPRSVNASSPRPAPCTVTDADPVPARLSRRSVLMLPKSTEYAPDMLPVLSPDVMLTRLVPPAPCPAMHLTDVSDSHSVPSHPVWPDRAIPVKPARPRFEPCTVTGADPVPCMFPRDIILTEPGLTENASDMLPTRSPAVIATRRVPGLPTPTMHLTDVSDSHSVPSHPV